MAELWPVAGAIAVLHGVNALEHARAGRQFRPWPVIGAILCGYLSWEHGRWLLASGGLLRLSGSALFFGTAAPLLGYAAYGHGGAVRRLLLRCLLAFLLAGAATFFALRFLLPEAALIVGAVAALVPFLPSGELKRWLSARKRSRAERREQRLEAAAQAREAAVREEEAEREAELLSALITELRR